MLPYYRLAIVAALLGSLLNPAAGAELGDPLIRTHIGQPLIADIELNTLSDPGSTVVVRMAHADVYRGANISMNPVLGSINMSVMKRDGRQYLHITSTRPVTTENVHLFLELTDGGKRNVRAVTLWLTPDPTPAPPPALPVVVPPPVAAPVPAAAPAAAPVAAPAMVKPRPVRVLTLPAAPVAAASCPVPRFTEEQIKTCEGMDAKNAALSAQIVDLEAKVKLLQLAIEGKPVTAEVAKPAPPPRPKKIKKEESGFPWLLVIGLVTLLAAIGGGVWFLLRRRKAKAAPADPALVPWHKRMLTRFKRKPKPPADEAPPAPPAP